MQFACFGVVVVSLLALNIMKYIVEKYSHIVCGQDLRHVYKKWATLSCKTGFMR
jgi:hypothetical protein